MERKKEEVEKEKNKITHCRVGGLNFYDQAVIVRWREVIFSFYGQHHHRDQDVKYPFPLENIGFSICLSAWNFFPS